MPTFDQQEKRIEELEGAISAALMHIAHGWRNYDETEMVNMLRSVLDNRGSDKRRKRSPFTHASTEIGESFLCEAPKGARSHSSNDWAIIDCPSCRAADLKTAQER